MKRKCLQKNGVITMIEKSGVEIVGQVDDREKRDMLRWRYNRR